jgi:putative protease
MEKKKMQILAPAGGRQQLIAAVRSGADAVYLGAGAFNARQNAENFGDGGLREAVAYCHGRGVKVHVTLNTLVTDREMPALLEQLREIAESGADVMIVQDLGVAALARECCPSLPIHASTQLSIHNAAGARAMKDLGFSCIVLARELTAGEITAIHREVGEEMDLETFVHGALCMSFSGQCYLSAMLGERSGNRGLCAQPCRLDFRSPYGREYALSLKDLSLVDRMKELEATGVSYLKIEGRMKRPEYVAAATAACRAARDGLPYDTEALRAVFSRSGFTDGYFTGRRDLSMFGWRRKEDVTAAAGVLRELEASYRAEAPLVPVDMELSIRAGEPVTLAVTDGERRVTREGEIPQAALKRPTDEALCRRALEKTGGTPFHLRELRCQIGEGLMVPVSALNALRKTALEELLALREKILPHPFREPAPPEVPPRDGKPGKPELRVRVERAEQLSPILTQNAARVILPVEELGEHRELLGELGSRLTAELPAFVPPQGEKPLLELLSALRGEGLSAALCGSPGAAALARRAGLRIFGDWGLNILNSRAMAASRAWGVEDLTLSFEANLRQAVSLNGGIPFGVIAYGHLPLMTFRACPAQGPKGCGGCQGRAVLRDRLGKEFPVLCHRRQYSQLLNSLPLYLGDKQDSLRGLDHATLRFTVEDPGRCARIMELWLEGSPLREERTNGLYFRDLK